MKILLLNPNTTVSMTEAIASAARAVAAPGTEVIARQPDFGPVSLESHYDEAVAAAGVAQQVRMFAADPPDAAVIACFGDPGLDAAREALPGPVLGIAEAAFHMASFLATGFSVVTTMKRTCVMAERLVQRYGFERSCRGIHGTDIPVLALEQGDAALLRQLEEAARSALARDGSAAIVLGCAGMAPLCTELSIRLGVPVVDGVAAAIKLAEALVGLGLGTAKRGDYAPPPPKPFLGWAAPLAWEGA